MTKKGILNNLIYYLFCGFCGSVIAAIVWSFLRIMDLGIELLWSYIPDNFNFKFYPLAVCTVGGLIIGIFQKLTKAVPDELDSVIKKVKKDKFYPYDKVLLLCVSALLPLLFGGSVGPEAGLTGVIVGLCYWAGSNMKTAKSRIPDLLQIGISATLGTVFYAPLFGLIVPVEETVGEDVEISIPRSSKMISNIIAVLCSIGTLYVLKSLFGGGSGLPRVGDYTITNTERIWGIPLAILGALFGILFVLFGRLSTAVFSKIQKKAGIILSTVLGGAMLGLAGTYLPLVMFSGEESISELQLIYKQFAPWLLIATGILKLLITNVCIKSGWMGGHFFPVIFCGIIIGYGVALITSLDIAFCAAVITAGLLGVTMKKPLAVTVLLLLCFDIRILPWILVAAAVGSIVPFNNAQKIKNKKECTK